MMRKYKKTVNSAENDSSLSNDLFSRRVILEPAGALAVAGLKKYVEQNEIKGQTMVAITSGANMDFTRL